MSPKGWVFQQGVLWAMDFRRPAPPPVPRAPRVAARFAEVRREALAPLARAMEHSDPSQVLRRLETGRRCFAGWLADEIVSYGWLSQGDEWVGELERRYRLPAGDAYIWQCATVPRWREHGLYGALLRAMTNTLRAEGAGRVWIGTNLENRPSLRAFASGGFQPVIRVTYGRLLSLNFLWMRRQQHAPAELVAGARQMLTAPHERLWRSWLIGRSPARGLAAPPEG